MKTDTTSSAATGLLAYDPALEDEIIAFQRQAYPNRDPDLIPARWRWMYVDSARRLDVAPMAWVYRSPEGVTAHQGAIAVRIQVHDQVRTTGWFVETMTLESVRGKTVGPAVIMKAKQDLPFNLSLGQTPQMRKLQFRLGWQRVAPLETWLLPLNAGKIVAQKITRRFLAGPAAGALHARRLGKRLLGGGAARGLEAQCVDRFSRRHDALWESIRRHYRCAAIRDAAYLNWKYVDQPGQSFARLELLRDGAPVAVAVLMFRDPDEVYRYRRAFVVDVVAPPRDRRLLFALLDAVKTAARDRDADAVLFHVVSQPLSAAIAAYGFLPRPATRHFLVCAEGLDGEQRDAVLDPNNWLITMGDSDIDRPW